MWKSPERKTVKPSLKSLDLSFPKPEARERTGKEFNIVSYPTIQFFDGRDANRPWLQELPDPLTQITWGNWLEIHPETAKRLEVRKGDLLLLESPSGSIEIPAYPYPGNRPQYGCHTPRPGPHCLWPVCQSENGQPRHSCFRPILTLFGRNGGLAVPVTIKKTGKIISLSQYGRKPISAWTGNCSDDLV